MQKITTTTFVVNNKGQRPALQGSSQFFSLGEFEPQARIFPFFFPPILLPPFSFDIHLNPFHVIPHPVQRVPPPKSR